MVTGFLLMVINIIFVIISTIITVMIIIKEAEVRAAIAIVIGGVCTGVFL